MQAYGTYCIHLSAVWWGDIQYRLISDGILQLLRGSDYAFQPAEKREKTGLCDTVCGDEGHVQGIICHSHEEGDVRSEQAETQTKCAGVPWNLHAVLAV